MSLGICRNCDLEILWTVTTNGKKMPVDPEPSLAGQFEVEMDEDPPLATFVREDDRDGRGDLYECHFDTCTKD